MALRNCFVAMFDVLGFRHLRSQLGTARLHQLYTRALLPGAQHAAVWKSKRATVDGVPLLVPDEATRRVSTYIFSDTFVYVAPDDSFSSFLAIVAAANSLLQFGFAGHHAPLRGAIGYGDAITEPAGIVIGSAIEDAYQGEQEQVWSGCAFTTACEQVIADRRLREQHDALLATEALSAESADRRAGLERARLLLVNYPLPVQQRSKAGPVEYSTRNALVNDWTLNVYDGASEKSFSPSDSPHAKLIASNTQAFERWARARHR